MKNIKMLVLFLVMFSLLLAACGPSEEPNFPTGKFSKVGEPSRVFIFNEDGTWIVLEGSSTLVRATYTVEGDIFTETSNDAGCTAVPMRFKYTFDGTNLTFNYVGNPADDPCGGRRADMDNVTYTLSEE